VKDREIDEALERAAGTARAVDATVLKRVADAIGPTLEPVRPLPPPWRLTAGLVLVCAAVAFAAAARAGFYGFEKLGVLGRVVIFCTLGILAWLAASGLVREVIPGSRRRLGTAALFALVSAVLLGVFALLFHDYRSDHFVAAGLVCLTTGIVCAVPAALVSWPLVRRGFAVSPVAAGLAGGALAGLAGVTLLELNCLNFQALHVLVWHTAVVPASAAAGALVGWALRGR
jgi:hypothetical protein